MRLALLDTFKAYRFRKCNPLSKKMDVAVYEIKGAILILPTRLITPAQANELKAEGEGLVCECPFITHFCQERGTERVLKSI